MSVRSTLLLATVAVLAACGGKPQATNAAPTVVLVGPEAVTVVERGMLATGPALSGSLAAERTASIRAEVGGQVLAILHEPGDRVGAGTVLARIDDRAIADAWLSAKSGVTQAELAADIAKRELERAVKLNAAGAISDRDMENARRANLAAQAQLEDAKSRLALAQKQKDATLVKAPYAGIVAERTVNAGDVVAPGAPLFTVVDPATMRLEANIPASQLGAVRLGAPVTFSVTGYPDRRFKGTISHIAPSADAATRQVRVIARIPNAGTGLVAGLFAEGRVSSTVREALTAPLAAVDLRGIRPVVARLKGGKVERLEVTVGARDDATERVELTAGVARGDTLLVGAALGITPGTPLKVSTPSDTKKN
ncbi:MAG: efflux RND transporter periplasmic adaptor subunit [Gemmatimonadota bacterium]|nr:efflux RND transporter periplasmic adaptor subunit [Gemmatimonadota bacterium]